MEQVFTCTIKRDEDIRTAICNYVVAQGWKDVIITGAIGSVYDMVYTTPLATEIPIKATWTPVYPAAEIVSFVGEVMTKDLMAEELRAVYPEDGLELFIHIHASGATAGGHVFGGGLKSGKAFRSLRVFITPIA